jgi:hypothetical protein
MNIIVTNYMLIFLPRTSSVSKLEDSACCLHHQGDALMIEAVSTSETSVNFYQITRYNNLEDSHVHSIRRENPKSHSLCDYLV